jgi:hypothetical protein
MTTAQLSLQTDIARQLSTELGDSGMVTCRENQVTVVISLSNITRSEAKIFLSRCGMKQAPFNM